MTTLDAVRRVGGAQVAVVLLVALAVTLLRLAAFPLALVALGLDAAADTLTALPALTDPSDSAPATGDAR